MASNRKRNNIGPFHPLAELHSKPLGIDRKKQHKSR
jgi:hypothetical protein